MSDTDERKPDTERKPEYLVFDEVVQIARVPAGTVRFWIQRGRLPAYRPGKTLLVIRSDLDAFLQARRVGAR